MKALKKPAGAHKLRRARLAEVLLEVSNKIAVANTLAEAFEVLTVYTLSVINAEQASVFLSDPRTGELYTRIPAGKFTREVRMSSEAGVAGHVFTTGRGIIIADAYADDRFNPEIDKKTGYVTKNILCVPLRTLSGHVIGVSELLNKDGDFNLEDLELLEAVVRQAAIALESRRTAEEIERDRQQQLELLKVVSEVATEIKLGPLLQKLIGAITKMLDAERSTLFLNDDKTSELYTEIGEGLGATQIRFPNHVGIAGTVFKSAQSVNIPHAYADLRFNPAFDKRTGFFTRSILCVPVVNKDGKTIGVTQVLNKKGGTFTSEDEARLKAFTSQIAIALENAKLFDDVQNMKNYNEGILESMSSGVITLNEDGIIVTCNSAGLRIMKCSAEAILKRPAGEVFCDANKWVAEKIELVSHNQTQEVTMDAEIVFTGETVSANVTVLPLASTQQKKLGSLIMIDDITGEKRLKSTMSRYMDPSVAEKMLLAGAEILGGQSTVATVLFSDIRSFTTLTEELGPQATVSLLNEYFTIMVDCIQYEGGMLDKFIGDAIMAVFGIPISHEDDEDRGVRAAINMLRELNGYNIRRAAEAKKPIQMGIGINTDTIVSGNIGSPRRMDYTVIGDGVNLASRLEGACKQYHARLLISEYTFKKLHGTYRSREIDRVIVKGKTQPVGLVEIVDYHSDETFPNIMEVLNAFRHGLRCYRDQRWDEATRAFKEALGLNPSDFLSQMYVDRCEHLKKTPPGRLGRCVRHADQMNILYLKEEDVASLVNVPEVIEILDAAFRDQAAGRAWNNPRNRLRLPAGSLHMMAGAIPGYFGYKAYTIGGGKAKFFFFLYSAQTTDLLAMMEADTLGQIRTGAATGLATRALSKPDSTTATLFGAGWQAQTQLLAMDAVRQLKRVYVVNQRPERRDEFIKKMQPQVRAELVAAASAEDSVRSSDIVTTITGSRDPVLNGAWLQAGVHINAAGGNGLLRREFDDEVVNRTTRLVVDSIEQCKIESGEFVGPIETGKRHWEDFIELRDVVAGLKPGRTSPSDITLFKSGGIAMEDVAIGKLIYERAVERGIGRSMGT